MKKLLLRAGLLSIGSASLLGENLKLYAYEGPAAIYSKEQNDDVEEYLSDEELVDKYAKVYEIDPKIAKDKFNQLTGYSHSIIWRNNCEINGEKYNNRELAILSTVRDIYRNPGEYDLTYEEIEGEDYEPTKCHEDVIWDYSNIIDVNKEVALAITYWEVGPGLSSANYLDNHNPAGLGPHNYYLNFEEGIVEYLFVLHNGYGITKYSDGSVFYGMQSSYCGDGSNWADNVSSIYYGLTNNYYGYADSYGREHYTKEEQEKIKEKEKVLGR